MGLFGFLSPKTKADWDKKIMELNSRLANAKASLAQMKADKKRIKSLNFDGAIHHYTFLVESLKAEIANAKIQRRNAPK